MTNYFSERELACKHCGEYFFDERFLDLLNRIRHACGFPLVVTSGYRCPEHPEERRKARPGAHSKGLAVDLSVNYERAYVLLNQALCHGVPRIGINQKGGSRFIHLDVDVNLPNPRIWSY